MSLEALTLKEKKVIVETLQTMNAKYGSGGKIVRVNWANKSVKISGGKTAVRPFGLGLGARPDTFRLKFAGQQAVTKAYKLRAAMA